MPGGAAGPSLPSNYATIPVPCNASTPGGGPPVWVHAANGGVCSFADQTDLAPGGPGIPAAAWDVLCKNGGQRYWDAYSHTGNNACRCPDGWTGFDCSQCISDAACPDDPRGNKTCMSTILPYFGSTLSHMQYTCKCFGPMASICNSGVSIPNGASFVVDYYNASGTGTLAAWSDSPDLLPQLVLSGLSFWGQLFNCAVSPAAACDSGGAVPWADGTPCATMICDARNFQYPQPLSCAGQAQTPACNDHDICPSSWRYRGCSFGDMSTISSVSLQCQYSSVPVDGNGAHQPFMCSVTAGFFGPFPVMCTTGSCEYDSPSGPPTPPQMPPPAFNYGAVVATFAAPVALVVGGASAAARVRARRRSAPAVRRAVGVASGPSCASPSGSPGICAPAEGHVFLEFEGLSFTPSGAAAGAVPVLSGVTGCARIGTLAILGPSGAGKTTLLDILGGRKYDTHIGSVRLNGGVASARDLRECVGYVMQDDALLGTMTVREHLDFYARLRLQQDSTSSSSSEINAIVENAISELGLAQVADVRCGDELLRGISGGERRRVGVAAGLFTDSRVLLIDEPTSGLDSTSAQTVMECITALARGRAVVMSIHQPRSDIWAALDHVLVLSARGQCLYCGPRSECVGCFERFAGKMPQFCNPAEFVVDAIGAMDDHALDCAAAEWASAAAAAAAGRRQVTRVDVACEEHTRSTPTLQAAAAVDADVGGGVPGDGAARVADAAPGVLLCEVSRSPDVAVPRADVLGGGVPMAARKHRRLGFHRWMLEFREICLRTLLNTYRHPLLVISHVASAAAVGIIVSFIYTSLPLDWAGIQNRCGFAFFTVTYCSMSALSAIGTWRAERLLFVRERASGVYVTSAYFAAKVLCDVVPLRVLPPLCYAAIVYWSLGLNAAAPAVGTFVFLLVMTNVVAAVLCLAVGAAVPSDNLANLSATLLLLLSLLFCGFMISKVDQGGFLAAVHAMSFLNYAFEALLLNEFVGQTFVYQPAGFPYTLPLSGRVVLDQLGMHAGRLALDCGMLGVLLVVWLVIAFLVLRFVVKERR